MTTSLPSTASSSTASSGPASAPGRRPLSVVIIGTGFGGLATAVELRRRGLTDVTLLEKADRIGGVWRDNTYPGAACDVPSSLYSYSFAPNPEWTRRYSTQPEILDYIDDVAEREGLLDRVVTGCEVSDLVWQEETHDWRVETSRGTYRADAVVSAVGQLSRPQIPALPGIGSFAGPAFHSAQWRHDVDLAGKRVLVVGTGASAIQFVPEIQKVAGRVTVFQRSAPYVVPKPDRGYTGLHHTAFRRLPPSQVFGRELTRALSELLNKSLAERTAFTKAFEGAFRLLLRAQVKDPVLRAKLIPDYPLGCKRLLFSNNWYPALVQPNVDVVTEAVAEVLPQGVRTADGTVHEADVLIYGTGFKATEFLAPMHVVGREGRVLEEEWSDGARAHLGITVPGFPNLFLVYGPNTNLGGSSIISMIECQTGYLAQLCDALAAGDLPVAEVRADVAAAYDQEMQERLADSVWSGCTSWYRTDGGRVTTNWPGLVSEYRSRTAAVDLADFAVAAPDVTPRDLPHPVGAD